MGKRKAPPRDPILVAFGLAVLERRRKLGISQEEAAERARIHRTYWADVERGKRNIGLRNIVAIARGMETAPSALLKEIR